MVHAPKTARALLLLGGLSLLACDEGGGGDQPPIEPTPGVVGDGLRLATLNDPDNPRPDATQDLIVTGVSVVAVDSFDETQDGASAGNVFAQDLVDEAEPHQACSQVACTYSGVTVFDPSYSPPALRVAPGDVVDIRGRYDEFPGPASNPFDAGQTLPEIVGGTLSLRFEHHVPEPITIDLNDLKEYDTGRQWLGMLVRVENVRIFSDGFESGAGRYSARLDVGAGVAAPALPTITNALFPVEDSGLPMTAGTTYSSVVGVVQYFFNFSIAPRSAEDLTQ